MTTILIVGGVILLAMIGMSWYGWVTLPADARVPVHFGAGYNNFVPKRIGLILHPAAGALVFVITILASHHAIAVHGSKSAPDVILPIIMVVLLAVQFGAIKVARSRSVMSNQGGQLDR
jgi:hypothetical protein